MSDPERAVKNCIGRLGHVRIIKHRDRRRNWSLRLGRPNSHGQVGDMNMEQIFDSMGSIDLWIEELQELFLSSISLKWVKQQ
jgi:hypothetical protein